MCKFVLSACLSLSGSLSALTVLNDNIRFDFAGERDGFGIVSVVNLLTGYQPFVESCDGPNFWSASFRRLSDARTVTVSNRSPCGMRRVERNNDGGATFVWDGVDLPNERGVLVVSAKVLLSADGTSRWTLEIKNKSTDYALLSTRYPIFRNVCPVGSADVLLPRPDLGAKLVKRYRGISDLHFGCMGYCPMMTAFFRSETGLYFAAHDSQSRIKTLTVAKDNTVSFVTPVENAGVPGCAAEGPRFEVTVAAICGDWWAAAKLYRAWALTAPWTARGRILDRTDYPRRLAEIPLWINTHADPCEASNTMARAKGLFPNHAVGLHWHLWQHSGHDVNYPEYFPEQPGTRECLAFCRNVGTEAMPYANGRLWSTNLVSYTLVRHLAMQRENGQPYVERYGGLTPPMSPMCPATAAWDVVVNDIAARVLDLGAGSLFLDQIGACAGRPCYSPSHGHPIGGGVWYFDGYQSLLTKAHALYSRKGAFLTTEGSGEQWMNVIDGYLQVTQRTPEDVPFFHAVYSGYTTYFCSPENHEDDLDSFWAAQARELVWGQSLGWYHPLILEDAAKCALIRRLTEFRQAHLDCFAYGSLDGELSLGEVPRQPVTWLGRKQFYMWKVKDAPLSPPITGELPGVIGTIWRTGLTGERKAFIANLTSHPQTVKFGWNGQEREQTVSPYSLLCMSGDATHCAATKGR